MDATFVVVGGGIAGVSCIEILSFIKPDCKVILISESPLVKAVVNFQPVTKTLTSFDVVEQDLNTITNKYPMITVLHDTLTHIDSEDHRIRTKSDKVIRYKYLCLCMGGSPKVIPQGENSPFVLGIRDTDSVDMFIEKLKRSQRIAIVGNGGIASELIYKLDNIDIDWIVKDKHTSATFVDAGASEFLKSSIDKCDKNSEKCSTRHRYRQTQPGSGAALGIY